MMRRRASRTQLADSLANSLATYLPPAVARLIQTEPHTLQQPADWRFAAAVLFADVSGFTALTEKLAAQGAGGAEELTSLLNHYFSRMIGLLEQEGGEVVQFSGDALLALFPAVQTASSPAGSNSALPASVQHAWQAANQMQSAMGEFETLATSVGPVNLGMKISIGAGEVRTFSVGAVQGKRQYIVAGDPLRQVGEAEHQAARGQIVLSPEAQALRPSQPLPPRPLPPLAWPAATAETIAALQSHVPDIVTHRLAAGQAEWLAELRRLTILFFGIGGLDYQAPTALDQVQSWIEACQQIVYRYEGSLNKLLVDDKGTIGIALFGAPPYSHEDDPLRAVRCALDLQAAAEAQGLRLAIGLTTGQVFAGPVGSPTRREYTVMGDAVNLAARLMQLAGAGGIRADHVTYQATRTTITWQALTPQTVKGKAAAVRLYQPMGLPDSRQLTPASEAGEGTPRFIGRTAERAHISQLFQESVSGRFRLLCLEGEPGIGKSRLVTELAQQIQEQGLVGLLGSGDALEQQTSYNAWRGIFRSYFDLDDVPDPGDRRQKVLARLAEVAPGLAERAPLLNDLLNLGLPESDLTRHLEPRLRQASLAALMIDLLTLWAGERPLVVIIEDAQWLDSLSWQLALQAARSLEEWPVLLMLVLRPLGELPSDHPYPLLRRLPSGRHLALGPLDADETTRLAARRLGVAELPIEIARFITQRAGGNPLVVEELARSLRSSGLITIVDDQCLLTGSLNELQAPETLHGLVLSSIDRLRPTEQLTLKVASVIGRTFSHTILHDVYPMRQGKRQLQASLDSLIRHEMVRPLPLPTMLRSHTFRQAVTQEVTYSTLLQSQRRDLHRQVAHWYTTHTADDQPELYPLLAYHWREAREAEKELHYAILAGKRLAADYANSEALSFLSRALQLSTEPATRYELLWLYLEVIDRVGDRRAQQDTLIQLQRIADAAPNARRQAQVANAWADFHRQMSDYPAAVASVQQARQFAQQAADAAGEARSLTIWGRVLEHQGAYREAKEYFAQALALYRRLGDRQGEANNLSSLSNIHRYLGERATAYEYALAALEIRRAIGDRASEATSLTNLALLSLELGDAAAAGDYRQASLQLARSIGDRAGEALNLIAIGQGHLTQGDYAAAQHTFQQALRLCQMLGDRRREANCLTWLGMVWRDVGDNRQAQQCFEQAVAIQEEIGSRSVVAYTYLNLGLARLPQDEKTACACYQQALALARETGNRDAEAYALSYNAAWHAHKGAWEAAARDYQAALIIRRELQAAAAAIEDLAGLARVALAQGDLDSAVEYARPCLAHLEEKGVEGIEFPLLVYLTCYDVLQATGETTQARRILEAAHTLLLQRANAVSDPALRQSMLQNVAANRRVLAEMSRFNP